jgi:DNA-binding transcriptional MerR regulator
MFRGRRNVTKDFYTIDEVADLLRVRPGTIRNRLWRGDATLPPSVRNGRRRLFPVVGYADWKKRLETSA